MGLVVIAITQDKKLPYYFIYGVEAIYVFLFTWKNQFIHKKTGRFVFILGEALMVAVFSFFLFKQSLLVDYHLDFIAVSVLLLLDIIYYTAELVHIYKHGVPKHDDVERVHPEGSDEDRPKKKTNAYAIDLSDASNEF